jgi:hypothetical protein
METSRDLLEEGSSGEAPYALSNEVIDLGKNWGRDHCLTTQFPEQRGCGAMRRVPGVEGGD